MKEYVLELPESIDEKKKEEIIEYLIVKHYEDEIFTSGACAYILGVEKFYFQTKILKKYNIDYME